MNGLPPVYVSNEVQSDSQKKYMKDLDKELVKRNLKSYVMLAAACFTLLALGVFALPKIAGSGRNDVVAQSNSIMKFAKVEGSSRQNGNVGVLAGDNSTTNSNAQRLGEAMNFGEDSRYVEIDLNEAETPEENIASQSESLDEYTAYVAYQSNIRSEPAKDGAVLSDKQRGDEVSIVGEEGDWYKILWGEDGYAYISKESIVNEKP